MSPFDYAVVRVVPSVEREEFVNAGAVVFCHDQELLLARIELSEERLLALDPTVDLALVRRHLQAIPRVCSGGEEGGAIGRLALRERWQWLVAPRSTILQTSAVHSGLCRSAEEALESVLDRSVRRAQRL